MPILVGSVAVAESLALYILITSATIIPFPFLLCLSLLVVYMFVIIIGAFKLAANPYVDSVALLKLLRAIDQSKWIKRFIVSFPPSKLTLGDGKFFDKATSLVIWRKTVDFLITCLLMQ